MEHKLRAVCPGFGRDSEKRSSSTDWKLRSDWACCSLFEQGTHPWM